MDSLPIEYESPYTNYYKNVIFYIYLKNCMENRDPTVNTVFINTIALKNFLKKYIYMYVHTYFHVTMLGDSTQTMAIVILSHC